MQDQLRQLFSGSPDAAMASLDLLDTNRDGQVDFSEVATFAKAKGLDYTHTLQEFAAFDSDHNGFLDAQEIVGESSRTPSVDNQQQQQRKQQQPQQYLQQPEQLVAPANAGGDTMISVFSKVPQAVLAQSAAGLSSTALTASTGSATRAVVGYSAEAQQAMLAKVSRALSQEVTAESEAAASEGKVVSLRSRLKALRGSVAEQAQESAQTAAAAEAQEILLNLQQMHEKAAHMQVAAAAIRAKNAAVMQGAELLTSAASEAFAGSNIAGQSIVLAN